MKNLKSKISLLSIVLLLSFSSTTGAQQFNDVSVDQIWAGGRTDGTFGGLTRVVTSASTFTNLNNTCERTNEFVIYAGNNPDGLQRQYWEQQFSLLLAAQQSNSNVTVFISGCTEDGVWPRAVRVTTFR